MVQARISLAVVWVLVGGVVLRAQPAATNEVLSILGKCTQCHGESLQVSGLDLHTRAGMLKGGEKGPAITPGNAEGSLLYKRVTGEVKPMMPMPPVPALTTHEIAVLKAWIEQGAKWADAEQDRKSWAFQKPVRHPAPAVSDSRWSRNPIDAFVRKNIESKGLEPAPQADKRTLMRRAYLDLWGLLPPPEEVEAFVKNTAPDAYENLIDRLLASPHYGERWGRFWLDVVRYADSSGFEFDRDIVSGWRYRDYVIKAFNEDKPYDRFVVEQLAGDELDKPTYDSVTATAFYRVGPRVRYREKQNPSNRYDYVDDVIRTTFQGFMGLSVNCARCHDHKFDPITQMDYYRTAAMLWGYVDFDHPLVPQTEVENRDRIRLEVEKESRPLRKQIAAIEKPYRDREREKRIEQALSKYPEDIRVAYRTPEAQRTPGQKLLVSQLSLGGPADADNPTFVPEDPMYTFGGNGVNTTLRERATPIKVSEAEDAVRKALLAKIGEIEKRVPPRPPFVPGVRDGDYRLTPDGYGDSRLAGNGRAEYNVTCCYLPEPGQKYEVPALHFRATGNDVRDDEKNPVVRPGFLSVIGDQAMPVANPPGHPVNPTSGRRRALGEWIVSKDNPLTARVMVNRIWGWHFARGIVATPGNFGKMGVPPSHPELLDWLATEFMRQNWSVKRLQRLIMTSETYKMASSFYRSENVEKDPANISLWKFPIHRVEAELVRDMMLSASGQINLEFGGEPFFPAIPLSVRATQPRGKFQVMKEGPATWKRGVYAYVQRGLKYPMFEVFDTPDLNITCEKRDVSTVPTQALTLMNNEFPLIQSGYLAERVVKAGGADPAEQVRALYRITLGREPSVKELATDLAFIKKQREAAKARGVSSEDAAHLSALTDAAHVVMNSNEFLYIQ